jgi:hypothetical protein
MPADWLFYWMTLPGGLAVIALAIALPFLVWRAVLGPAFLNVRYAPLGLGYFLASLGMLAFTFGSSYLEFSSRVSSNVLPEQQRWSIVPGWTIYMSVLSLVAVLPLVGVFGVPVSALLVRFRRFSIRTILAVLLLSWLSLALVLWLFPSNQWEQTHRFEALSKWITALGPAIFAIGAPFLGGIYFLCKRRWDAET